MEPHRNVAAPESAPLRLRVIGAGGERVFESSERRIVLGRSRRADLVFDDPRVSRFHCSLERAGNHLFVVDLDSQNGTFLDGTRVVAAPLFRGGRLRVGGVEVVVEAGVEPPLDEAGGAARDEVLRELARERAFLVGLVRSARHVVEDLDLDALLCRLLEAILELSGAERAFVVLADDEGRLGTEASSTRDGRPVADAEVAVSRSIAREVLRTGRPLTTVNAREDERFREVQSIVNLGLRSALCLPLRHRGRVLGVVYLDDRLESGVFTPRDTERLAPFADLAAVAVEHARLVAGLNRSNRALEQARRRLLGQNRVLRRTVDDREAELATVRARLEGIDPLDADARREALGLLGFSPALCRAFATAERMAATDFPVLLEGESGTGKELFARALHRLGRRRLEPFLGENCAAFPEGLLESELFGSVRGAFTGATDRVGLLERAHGGTLFLDEVSELPPSLQGKLLRFLQEGEFRPLGSSETRRVDVRVIAASNRDLRQAVREGRFREDLFFRLAVLTLRVPPLREREGDVVLLAMRFAERAAAALGRPPPTLAPEVLRRLERYPWPGNVRELENEIRRMVTLADEEVRLEHLSEHVAAGKAASPPADGDLVATISDLERHAIERALRAERGNKSRAARRLGISRFALHRKMEKYGIAPPTGD